MDKKILAILVVAVVVVAGAATALVIMNNDDDDHSYSIVSRVNTEGSGVYIKESLINGSVDSVPTRDGTPYYSVNEDGSYSVNDSNKAAWNKLIIGTPGTASIQHIQMATLMKQMGLEFKLYVEGSTTLTDGYAYYNAGITNASLATDAIDAGILWEPQYQLIITGENSFTGLALTNNLFPGHTCCVIAGDTKYVADHSDSTEAFLKGYVRAVNEINSIKEDTTSSEYKEFVDFIKEKVPAFKSDVQVDAALKNITYTYADDSAGSLDSLKSDISDLAVNLENLGVLTKDVKDTDAFSKAFVNDTYLKNAISKDIDNSNKGTITVAVISGDIHQIAIHYAIEKGYFAEYGVNVQLAYASNGTGVATAIQNGTAQFGFIGAPPATITAINSGFINA